MGGKAPVQSGILKMENWLSEGYAVIASLAPSYLAEFEEDFGKVVSALIKLGFHGVEETITVLPEIVEIREKAKKYSRNPIIYNSCPVVWDLIDSHYHKLKKYLLNIPSPMILHSCRLKERFPGVKTIFIGPCEAKEWEQQRFYNTYFTDLVITFKELREILEKNKIDMKNLSEGNFLSEPPAWAKACILYNFKSGLENVTAFLEHFHANILDLPFDGMELLACEGGCMNGPGMTTDIHLDKRIGLYCKRI
jgi:iron only hydrogenase large subunit-like protein